MTTAHWMLFWIAVSPIGLAMHIWAEKRCTIEDVRTGRRDRMALWDDYGSNRGWYWRWKPISLLGLLLAAPGLIISIISLLIVIASS